MTLDNKIINFDINRNNLFNLTAKQFDTNGARSFTFRLLKDSIPFDLTGLSVKVGGKKPDGKDIFNSCTIKDTKKGIVELELTTQMQIVAGALNLELIFLKDTTRLSTIPFGIKIIQSATCYEKVQNSDEFEALQSALWKTDNVYDKSEINNFTWSMANMGQDVKEAMTGGSVAVVGVDAVGTENLKKDSVTKEKANFFPTLESIVNDSPIKEFKLNLNYKNGFITSSNHSNGAGSIITHDSYIYTDMFAVTKGSKVKIHASTSSNVCVLSSCNKDGSFLKELIVGDDRTTYYEYTVEQEVEYLRVCNNIVYLSLDKFNLFIKSSNSYLFEKKIDEIYSQIIATSNTILDVKKLNLNYKNGFITSSNHSNGAGNIIENNNYVYTDMFAVTKGSKVKIHASTSSNVCVLSSCNKDGSFLKELIVGDDRTTYYEYTVEQEVEYLRVCNNIVYLPVYQVFKTSKPYEKFEKLDKNIKNINNKLNSLENKRSISPQTLRKPCVCFIFDDGLESDSKVFEKFNEYNLKCGFAILSTIDSLRVSEYLDYQNNGFEILSHSTDGEKMYDGTDSVENIENKFKTSKSVLENYGFNITSWVTPNSELHEKYFPSLEKYYELAYTVYLGEWDSSNHLAPYNTFKDDTRHLYRMSLESSSLENILLAIDKTIEAGGFLTFYAHAYPSSVLPEEKLSRVLEYVKGKCLVMNPRDCYKNYFALRHSDFLNLLK